MRAIIFGKLGKATKGETHMPISKTDFIRGLQCEKMLWLDAHAPQLKIIPPEIQQKLDAGNEFGDNAMGIFGPFVETTTLKEDGKLYFAEMIRKTQTLLSCGETVICEGSFSWYGNFCAADILKKEGSGYALYEVKNTNAPREEFFVDLGFQRLILRKNGVLLTSCNLVLRGEEGEENLIEHNGEKYKIVNADKQARLYDRLAQNKIFELGKLKRKDAPMPNITTGEHCDCPYRCWYYEHCHCQNQPNQTD